MLKRIISNGKGIFDWVFFEKGFAVPDYDNPKGKAARIRWRLFHCPWFGVYLHKWNLKDPRDTLHNHPWTFLSIILWGNYEEIVDKLKWHNLIRWFNYKKRTDFHNVTYVKPGTWTLMFVGKTYPDWGYLENGKYIPFQDHPNSDDFKAALKERKSLEVEDET